MLHRTTRRIQRSNNTTTKTKNHKNHHCRRNLHLDGRKSMKSIHASGTRKTSKARATLTNGHGVVRVNSKLLTNIEPKIYKERIEEPLKIAGETAKTVNINIKVEGGGMNSQADACRLAIAKALSEYDHTLQQEFLNYDRTLLVADVRYKETHKPNRQGKARA